MFKNFLEKAKQKVDSIADDIAIKPQPKIIQYDESAFVFQVTGGPKHTELIQAIARVKDGDKLAGYIPLICKWFKSDDSDAMKEMTWATDFVYQPNVDDVGTRILVQANPSLENTIYTGMPLFSEIGPITLDPEIEKKALSNLEQDSCIFKVEVSQISPSREDIVLPVQGSLTFSRKEKRLTLSFSKSETEVADLAFCEYTESYPTIELEQENNKYFEVHFSSETFFKCKIDEFIQRDILALTIRACSKIQFDENPVEEVFEPPKIQTESDSLDSKEPTSSEPIPEKLPEKVELKHSSSVNLQPNLENLMKLETQAKQLKKLQKDNERLQRELEKVQKDLEKKNEIEVKLKSDFDEVNAKFLNFDGEKSKMVEEIANLNLTIEKLNEEKAFYFKEINLYKAQVQELDDIVLQYKNDERKRRHSLERSDLTLQYLEMERSYKAETAKLQIEIDQLNADNQNLKKDLQSSQAERESLEGQINLLKNKIKVLQKEQEKKIASEFASPPDSKGGSEIHSPTFPKKSSDIESIKPTLTEKLIMLEKEQTQNDVKLMEEELRVCKEQIKQLNSVILSQKISSAGKTSKQNQTNLDYLQKLVSNLTEMIAEKDNFIEQQKSINKHLGERLLAYEEKPKS